MPTTIEEDEVWEGTGKVKLLVDCLPLVGILNGETGTKNEEIKKIGEEITSMMVNLIEEGVGFHSATASPFQWRRRHLNKQADYAANAAMDTQRSRTAMWMQQGDMREEEWNIIAFSDGGKRKTTASYGWTALGVLKENSYELGWGYGCLHPNTDSLVAEAEAVNQVLIAISCWAQEKRILKRKSSENVLNSNNNKEFNKA